MFDQNENGTRSQTKDPFGILGNGAPIFRAILAGVQFPIKNWDEAIHKAGGMKRTFRVGDGEGNTVVYSLLDAIEAIRGAMPEFEKRFPFQSAEEFAKSFARLEGIRVEKGEQSLLFKIGSKNLRTIIEETRAEKLGGSKRCGDAKLSKPGVSKGPGDNNEEREPAPADEPRLPADDTGPELPGESGVDRSGGGSGVSALDWTLMWAEAAASDAAESIRLQTEACALADSLAGTLRVIASKATADDDADLLASARERAAQACALSREASFAYLRALAASQNARAYASRIPTNLEAQTAAANARDAASRAEEAANSAIVCCDDAREQLARIEGIASTSFVTIRGRVVRFNGCCESPLGAIVYAANVTFPEIREFTDDTNRDGDFSITGRFGPHAGGCTAVLVSIGSGSHPYREISVCDDDPGFVKLRSYTY